MLIGMQLNRLEPHTVMDAPCNPSNSSLCQWVKLHHQQVDLSITFSDTNWLLLIFQYDWKHILHPVGSTTSVFPVSSRRWVFGDNCLRRNSSSYNDLLCGTVQIHVGTSNHLNNLFKLAQVQLKSHRAPSLATQT